MLSQLTRIAPSRNIAAVARTVAICSKTIVKPVAVSFLTQQQQHRWGTVPPIIMQQQQQQRRRKSTNATTATQSDPAQPKQQQLQEESQQSVPAAAPAPSSSSPPTRIELDVDALQKIKETPHTPQAASVLDVVGMLDTVDDPSTIFQQVDSNEDGQINVDEFHLALTKLHYQRLADVHSTVHDVIAAQSQALQKKLELVLDIEDQLVKLAETTAQKQDVIYHNIGMTTAGDLDLLFAQSQLKRDTMDDKVRQLKALIEEAKSVYGVSWHVE